MLLMTWLKTVGKDINPACIGIGAVFMLCVGCGGASVPPLPDAELCTIDLPRSQLICFNVGGLKFQRRTSLNSLKTWLEHNRDANIIPLENADKFIAFSPASWEAVSSYQKEMRLIIEQKCRD